MKKQLVLSVSLLFLWLYSCAAPSDTTIYGVPVYFSYTDSPFPTEWQAAPISATAVKMDVAEISRCKTVMTTALKKYPEEVLQINLKALYFFKSISFYNVGYGGTNSTDMLYLTNNGNAMGYTNSYLEQTFHHEFSSILFRNYPALLDTVSWKNANVAGFDYNDPEAGVGAIRNKQSSQEPDTALCSKGFLTQYACSSLENDVNTIAQNLFRPDEKFWVFADLYPRIRKKVSLLISFYRNISAVFTEQYFRKFDTKQ